jgi:hypothetical protein
MADDRRAVSAFCGGRSWKIVLHRDGFLGDFDQAPCFVLRQRAGLHDSHGISDLSLIVFVMRLEFRRVPDAFMVQAVFFVRFDSHHDRFVHFVADHFTGLDFTVVVSFAQE